MDKKSRSLLDEQEKLLAEVNEGIRSVGTAAVFSEAIFLMNLIEGTMARQAREQMVTTDSNVALAGTVKFLNRLRAGDETMFFLAEGLSAKQLQSGQMPWGAKVARVLVLGYFLEFEFATSQPGYGMIARGRAVGLWSDLQKSVEAELTKV